MFSAFSSRPGWRAGTRNQPGWAAADGWAGLRVQQLVLRLTGWLLVAAALPSTWIPGSGSGFGVRLAAAQSCRPAAALQCRDTVLQMIQQHQHDYAGAGDVTTVCRTVRDNMACLLWQTANCQPREQQQRSGEHILAAKTFLDKYCDFDGGWRNSRCYQFDEVSRCENDFNHRRGSDACAAYNRFKECIRDVLKKRCSNSDEQAFPSYLVDRTRELSWTCPSIRSEAAASGSTSSSGRYNGYGSSYGSAGYDVNDPSGRSYSHDPFGRYTPDRSSDRYGYDQYNRYRPGYRPQQDEAYCLHRAQDPIRECDGNHERRQYNARRYHADERIKESCCATIDYRTCLQNALQNNCHDFDYHAIQGIVQQKIRDADQDCRQFDAYRCSSPASVVRPSTSALLSSLIAIAVVSVGAIWSNGGFN